MPPNRPPSNVTPSAALNRDRQARGHPPPNHSTTTSTSHTKAHAATKPSSPDLHEVLERKRRAAEILSSWEMLSWFAWGRDESIPQTRLRFQKQMLGMSENGDGDTWEDENAGGAAADEFAGPSESSPKGKKKGGADGRDGKRRRER